MLEDVKSSGVVTSTLIGPDGKIKQQTVSNLVMNGGLALFASRLKDATANPVSHVALGSGNTAAVASQTALVTELARVAADSVVIATKNVTGDSVLVTATFGAGSAISNICEAGLFNAASGGTMIARTVSAVNNKAAGDIFVVSWKITFV